MYYKTIVTDLDDTLSFTQDRDFENAEPNVPLIEKLNSLHAQGWKIIIATARGSISCPTREEADKKYRKQIESWLTKHSVLYHELTFQKPLGVYYIDDKAITPDDFQKIVIETLHEGLSGSRVERHGNYVLKTFKSTDDALRTAEAYRKLLPSMAVPKVYSVVGKTIKREFIYGPTLTEVGRIEPNDIVYPLTRLACVPTTNGPSFKTYVHRLIDHMCCDENNGVFSVDEKNLVSQGYTWISFADTRRSLCHGDMSLDNIICSINKVFFIDPIYLPNVWSSYLLDLSKFYHSCERHGQLFLGDAILENFKFWSKHSGYIFSDQFFKYLVTSHWIRLLKYVKDKPEYEEYETLTKKKIHELKETFWFT